LVNLRVFVFADNIKREHDFWLLKYLPRYISMDVLTSRKDLGLVPSLPLRSCYSGTQILKTLSNCTKYDIILSMDTLYGTQLSAIRFVLKAALPPHVMVDSSSLPLISSKFSLSRLFRRVFSSTKRIICFTRCQASFWNETLGFVDKAVFMPFGINLRDYRARNIESSSYIFSGGRTARDFGTLFKLANKINANFVVVTGYPAWSEINLRSIPKNVTVYFEVPENDYEELLLKSKFVVLTLHDVPYSCGLSSLLQAMAAGKAVIVTKTSSTLDYVSNWNTGIFVRPYDVNDLRDKIKYLLKNPKKAEEIGANGRWTVETLFNERNMAKNIIKVLTSVHREENTSADLINRRS